MIFSFQILALNLMTTTQLNHLNSILIVISAIIAWYLPFELFLFAYAILGPLHYFTEISWLHDKNYFCQSQYQSLPLYFIALLNFIFVIFLNTPIDGMIFIGFGLALLSMFTKSWRYYLLASILLIPLSQWIVRVDSLNLIFVSFLPTIIHVCIFTFIFMLFGSLKDRDTTGYVSVLIYLMAIALIFTIPSSDGYKINLNAFEILKPFMLLADKITALIGRELKSDSLVSSFRFLAFIYTFHYLNWFIKVKTIGWYNISKKRKIFIFIGWIASLGIYYYNFRLGLIVLFFFSITHVLLEFPLDFISIRAVGKELFFNNNIKKW